MPGDERAFVAAHNEAEEEAVSDDASDARVRRVRRRAVDDYDRAGRQIADVLRAAEKTRRQTEEWVQERHRAVDLELAARHDEATALEGKARQLLAEAEARLSDAEVRAREAVELQERAQERTRLMEAERVERAESDRREAERVLTKAKATAADIVIAAEAEAANLLRGVLAEQQQRLEHLRAEEERTSERMRSLLGAMPDSNSNHRTDLRERAGPTHPIDLRSDELESLEAPGPVGTPDTSGLALDAADEVVVGGGALGHADQDQALQLVGPLEEEAVADIVQSAIRQVTGRNLDDSGQPPTS